MLREVWLNIKVEKIDTHEGVIIKALLDSGITIREHPRKRPRLRVSSHLRD